MEYTVPGELLCQNMTQSCTLYLYKYWSSLDEPFGLLEQTLQ